ncbi:response regulator [Pseudomonas veronii]|uniref:Response regulator n=1 Tax=Pseudomonas veronii TaxID=76761 RepID=A0A5M8G029_PSEVE|nr:response regulator [Pseudomonas veronii]KAA6173815.1 response regulator [Pseudomonas veronii]KAA6189435.1 response regulator [Pseudomonas veronii]
MSSGVLPGKGTGRTPPHWRSFRVLVVDDHRAYCLLMGAMLQQLGVSVETCHDGQAALATLEVMPVALVFSDCQMPTLDGYAMTREIRRRERLADAPAVPVVALTASLGGDVIRRCRAAGMSAWLAKPATLEQLRNVLITWLPGQALDSPPGRRKQTRAPQPACWPSRAQLLDLFGTEQALERMLSTLMHEAQEDLLALADATDRLDASAAAQHLHRLAGSVAFLGGGFLEARGIQLVAAVIDDGVAANAVALGLMREELVRYLNYLSAL